MIYCKICGKPFKKITNKKYCSNKCSKIAFKKQRKIWARKNKGLMNSYKKNWKKRNSNKNRLINIKWKQSPKGKESARKYRKTNNNKKYFIDYRKKNKGKVKARKKAYSIKIENQKCEKCKIKKATERHHEDYNKPLEVMLVCKKCHIKLDKKKNG